MLVRKIGVYRPFIWVGMTLLTLGFGLFINFRPYASWPRIIIYQIIAGVGTGPNFQVPLIALQNRTIPQDVASAMGAFLFVRNLATAMSVGFGGAIFNSRLARLVALSPVLSIDVKQDMRSSLTSANASLIAGLPAPPRSALIAAYATALRDMWIFYTCAAAVGLVASLCIEQKALSTEHHEPKQGFEVEKKRSKGDVEQLTA